jgi:predicted ester cyclase
LRKTYHRVLTAYNLLILISWHFEKLTFEDLAAEEEKVAFRCTMTGTHNNEFMGIAATGKQFTVKGATFARLSNEKMSEAWLYWDRLGMAEQLGATLAQQ